MVQFMLLFIGFYLDWKLGLALIGLMILDYKITIALFKRHQKSRQEAGKEANGS